MKLILKIFILLNSVIIITGCGIASGEQKEIPVEITLIVILLLVLISGLFLLVRNRRLGKRLVIQQEKLNKAMTAAEDALQSKSYFLINMSYEIRTATNGIIGMTDLLQSERISERQLQYVKNIKMSAESLLGIINEVLELNKINEGMIQIIPVDIDLSAMLRNTISIMSFSARSKGLDFIGDIRINSPEYVRVDEVRLNQVIVNLLSNAIKFTKMGYVKLMAKIEDNNIVLEVSDTGIGIKQENISGIFTAFEQVDKYTNNTGLGLSISKRLVEMMNGKIWAESEEGAGSTFYVTIPYTPGNESAAKVINSEYKCVSAPTAQVLLVDDIQTNLTVGAGLLRLCKITADVAVSGREAIELVKKKEYDIVFMDHMMPEMDGIEAMKMIRSLGEKYRRLPIIALTANAMEETKEFLIASGMDDFLYKPIDKDMLMNILQKWLPAHKVESGPIPAGTGQAVIYTEALNAASKIKELDIRLALIRMGGMQNLLEASLKRIAYSIDKHLKKMDVCLSEGDLNGFAIEAHGLKGAFANVGAAQYSELAAELEIASKTGNMLLSMKKFAIFASIIENFAYELKLVFPQAEGEEKPRGNSEFLALKISEIIDCLNHHEATGALENINELSQFTFGIEADKILIEVKNTIEAFNYNKAVSMLIKQLPASAGKFEDG